MGAPACFIPSLAEMHINTSVVRDGRPRARCDSPTACGCSAYAPAVGACTHEAAHARHTHWDPRELMESLRRDPQDARRDHHAGRAADRGAGDPPPPRQPHRTCGAARMEIVGRDFKISDTTYGAATAAGLLLARVDAKVLTRGRGARRSAPRSARCWATTRWSRWSRCGSASCVCTTPTTRAWSRLPRAWLEALDEDPEDTDDMAGESMMGETPARRPRRGRGRRGRGRG